MADARAARTGPGGHAGTAADSSAARLYTPMPAFPDKSLPGPATSAPTPQAIPFPRLLPPPLIRAGPQPPSSGLCLTAARTGAHSPAGNNHLLTQRGAMSVRRRRGARRQAGGRGARERHRRGDLPVTADPGEADAGTGAAWTELGAEHVTAALRAAGRQPPSPNCSAQAAHGRSRALRHSPGCSGTGRVRPRLPRTRAGRPPSGPGPAASTSGRARRGRPSRHRPARRPWPPRRRSGRDPHRGSSPVRGRGWPRSPGPIACRRPRPSGRGRGCSQPW